MKVNIKLYSEGKRRWVGDFELPPKDEEMKDFVDDFVRYNHDRNEAELTRFKSLMRLQAGLNTHDPCEFEINIQSSLDESKPLHNELEDKRYRKLTKGW